MKSRRKPYELPYRPVWKAADCAEEVYTANRPDGGQYAIRLVGVEHGNIEWGVYTRAHDGEPWKLLRTCLRRASAKEYPIYHWRDLMGIPQDDHKNRGWRA